jgi:nucleotide-binding universal stress UspA family protein
MYKKILVPLDGSPRAEAILPHAERLARCTGAEIILLRVFKVDFTHVDYYGHDPEFYDTLRENCILDAAAYLARVQESAFEGLKTTPFIEEGYVVDMIWSVAARENVDLIAMSSHGRSGLSQVIFGSTASGVLRRADRPLLLIRSQEQHELRQEEEDSAVAAPTA